MAGANKGPIYVGVADALRTRIREGEIAPGQNLPSLDDLSDEFHVKPNRVREALRQLAHERLIETKPGVGSTVLEPGQWTSTEAAELMRQVAALRDEVKDMREYLERRIDLIERSRS